MEPTVIPRLRTWVVLRPRSHPHRDIFPGNWSWVWLVWTHVLGMVEGEPDRQIQLRVRRHLKCGGACSTGGTGPQAGRGGAPSPNVRDANDGKGEGTLALICTSSLSHDLFMTSNSSLPQARA
eukprot:458901-Rhodomonas_salina.2